MEGNLRIEENNIEESNFMEMINEDKKYKKMDGKRIDERIIEKRDINGVRNLLRELGKELERREKLMEKWWNLK